ncbi:E3 SUMO-protein ligase PIAS3 [Orchesella cincta]|uniref:E3 SUMO-protein ligase PIAS3 n=1 Tax=Orchesella cincta TaxID=48709 RepID=A0A1D2M992_ORCCI|nr:E3 SUMO-protein ligase PIAS3 [Orchesella cincta]
MNSESQKADSPPDIKRKNPGIRMKRLPFFDVKAELLKPTCLLTTQPCQPGMQEANHVFFLDDEQAELISKLRKKYKSRLQVILRFCELHESEEQTDVYPRGLTVSVNGRLILQSPEPSKISRKSFPHPLDITQEFKETSKSSNTICATWLADSVTCNLRVAVCAYLVRRLTVSDLLQNVLSASADDTEQRIESMMPCEDEDDLCAPTSIKVSLICPIGQAKMINPCKALTCKHIQCFDAENFLLLNKRKPTFICPVCNVSVKFEDLRIDRFFKHLLQEVGKDDVNEIQVFPDGRWVPVAVKKTKQSFSVVESDSNYCDTPPPPKTVRTEKTQDNPITLKTDAVSTAENVPDTSPKKSALCSERLGPKPTIKVELVDIASDGESEDDTNTIVIVEEIGTSDDDDSRSATPQINEEKPVIKTEIPLLPLKNETFVHNETTQTPCQVQPPQVAITKLRNGFSELAYLSKILNVSVSYSNFPSQDDYLSFVTLNTNPPHMAHGYASTIEEARNEAALKLLEEFTATGLEPADAIKPEKL